MRIVTSDEMRKIDEISDQKFGIDAGILMENAGRSASQVLLEEYPDAGLTTEIVILAGKGNNAGDAFVVARRLLGVGRRVSVFYLSPHLTPIERYSVAVEKNLKILKALKAKLFPLESLAELQEYLDRTTGGVTLIDGLFGTGLKGNLEGFLFDLVEFVNKSSFREVIALDIPSGVDGDNGLIRGTAIQAHLTVSFGFPKVGHFLAPGASKCGRLVNVDISLPYEFRAQTIDSSPSTDYKHESSKHLKQLISEEMIRSLLKTRDRYGYKNEFGHCLLIGGSLGRLGAIELAGKSAHRVGTGLISIGTWNDCYQILLSRIPSELMAFDIPLDIEILKESQSILKNFSSIVVGPGLGKTKDAERLMEILLSVYQGPLVIDADAINIISEKQLLNRLIQRRAPTVLTPHLGEMARMLQTKVPLIKEDLFTALREAMDQTHSVVVMKGASTLVGSPDGSVFLNHLPNDGMATAGSGDVLAGMIGGLMAQGYTAFESAIIGVRVHALAGKKAAEKLGTLSMTASDLVACISEAFFEITRSRAMDKHPAETRSYLY